MNMHKKAGHCAATEKAKLLVLNLLSRLLIEVVWPG